MIASSGSDPSIGQKPRRRTRLALVAALLLTAVVACQLGGTRPLIKIGLTAPFTGFDESIGYSVIGAVRLAVRERNLAGGVAGYRVELVALDDGNEPDMAAQRAREMIIDPAVVAVLGGFDGPAATAAAAEYRQAGMPFLAMTGSEALATGGGVLRMVAADAEVVHVAARYATATLQARRIAVIADETPGAQALAAAFTGAVQASGVAVVRLPITRWQLDFASTVGQLAATAPDLVFVAGRAAEAGELLRQMRAAGVNTPVLGGPGLDDARLGQIAAATAAAGVAYVSVGLPLAQVSDASLRQHLEQTSLRPAGPYTALAYDGANVLLDALARAIKAHGRPLRGHVATALLTSRVPGATGEITLDKDGGRRQAPLAAYSILAGEYPGTIVQ